jgi:hypothetical protein
MTREDLSLLARELRAARSNLTAVCDRVAALQQRLRTDAPTIVSLDRLAQRRHAITPASKVSERFEGEEASLGIDAWEISLINEEG